LDERDHDAELARRAARGDSRAFEELVRLHERTVYNLAYRMTGRPEDAKDVAQEAFLSAFRRLGSFRGDSSFSTWIHRITVNACYDQLRRRRREPTADLVDATDLPSSSDPERTASAAVDVQRALLHVPDEFRPVLVMREIQDMDYEEIAMVLEVPVGTVKSRLHRGRRALAEALGGTSGPAHTSEGKMER
jgi:RNA polymerase sigma-70 factor (ECF subfamily)